MESRSLPLISYGKGKREREREEKATSSASFFVSSAHPISSSRLARTTLLVQTPDSRSGRTVGPRLPFELNVAVVGGGVVEKKKTNILNRHSIFDHLSRPLFAEAASTGCPRQKRKHEPKRSRRPGDESTGLRGCVLSLLSLLQLLLTAGAAAKREREEK